MVATWKFVQCRSQSIPQSSQAEPGRGVLLWIILPLWTLPNAYVTSSLRSATLESSAHGYTETAWQETKTCKILQPTSLKHLRRQMCNTSEKSPGVLFSGVFHFFLGKWKNGKNVVCPKGIIVKFINISNLLPGTQWQPHIPPNSSGKRRSSENSSARLGHLGDGVAGLALAHKSLSPPPKHPGESAYGLVVRRKNPREFKDIYLWL